MYTEQKGMSVLIVDDDAEFAEQLSIHLQEAGIHAARASDGIDALSSLYATRAWIVLIDLVMPRMNGIELIEQIRSDPRLYSIGVVAMSGDAAMLVAAERAGADAAVSKPFDPAVIVRLVHFSNQQAGR